MFYTSFEKPLKMRRCKSYLLIKLMLFSWPLLNPDHIGVIGISKWRLLVVEPETPLSPFCFDRVNWPPNVILNLIFEIYTKFPSIWYIEPCIWIDERERERSLRDIERSWQRAHDRWGEFIIILWLWYHNWGQGTQLWECMSVPMYAGFQEKQCFRLMGCNTSVIDKWHYYFY